MTHVVTDNTSRSLIRTACLNSSAVPAGVTTITPGTDVGVVKIMDASDPLASAAAGVPARVKVIGGSVGSATYNLTVYGAMRVGGPLDHADGPWLWVPLYKGAVAATLAYAGYESDGYMVTADFLAVTHTAASNGPSDPVATNYGAAVGFSHLVIATRGCPYLKFVADAADKFVLACGLS